MEKFKVTFEANDQQLKSLGTKHASDTYADIEATFVLGSRWTDMDSVSAVWWNDFTRIATVLDSDGKCIVPHEVLTRKGYVRVNLVGSVVENGELVTRLTSYSAEAVKVNEKIKLTGSETSEITPSQYEQFVANVKADADRAEAGATASANSADEAEASAQNASESASASAVSASDSARSATASAGYAQNASESAQSAENAKDDAEDARDEILGMRATAETLEAGSDATASYSDGLLTLGIPRGDQGIQGIQGIQGETGATPNLTIGTVETLEPTEDATASITGTAENPVLNLGLPKGDTGEVSLEDLGALLPTDTASGDIASITDGQNVVPVKSLKVTLEPIQDLHGYDKPWSGGNGANKWDEEWELGALSVTGENVTSSTEIRSKKYIPVVGGQTYYLCCAVASTFNYKFYDADKNFISGAYIGRNNTLLIPNDARYMRFFMGAAYGTTYNHDIAINYPSSVTTYSPYSNICPISGHTECVTSVRGKNLFENRGTSGSSNGIDWTVNADGSVSLHGTATSVVDITMNFSSNKQQMGRGSMQLACSALSSYNPQISGINFQSDIYVDGVYVNTLQNVKKKYSYSGSVIEVGLSRLRIASGTVVPIGTVYYPQIELGSSPSTYEAFNGTTYTTDLGRTVYGGEAEIVGGVLTDKMGMVDLGSLDYTYYPTMARFKTTNLQGIIKNAPSNSSPSGVNAICSQYALTSYNGTATEDGTFGVSTDGAINIKDTRYTDATAFKSAVSGQTLVYELATPQTIQLTPQEIKLLLGTNNVWSDGNVTLVYSADIQRWVEKKLNANSTTSMLTMSRPMVQTETTETEETETETAETE